MNPFVERHQDRIAGVISCFDRVVITGSLPDICHANAMASYLSYYKIRLFDFPRWAESLRNEVRSNAERIASDAGLEIEFISKYKDFRKEVRIKDIIDERGSHTGWVHIFSAMEACPSFRLQVYFNGHYWLARRLDKTGIAYDMADNAFLSIADFKRAQHLADRLDAKQLHRRLDQWGKRFCPPQRLFRSGYHWSFMQVEYATDVLFHRQADFQPLYEAIVRTAVHSVKAEQVATFLGRKLTAAYQDEIGNNFCTRIQGTRIRHQMGAASLKLYDKFAIMARVECTSNDVSFFKLHRTVEQRDGNEVWKLAPLRKNIYSLRNLRKLMNAANERYLAFIAAIDNPDAGLKDIDKMAQPARDGGRSYRGFNLFLSDDFRLFLTIARGEWCISGFRAADLRAHLTGLPPSRSSCLLKRLRIHGLIKKVGRRYKYYLTKLGRRVVATALNIREYVVLPTLCASCS